MECYDHKFGVEGFNTVHSLIDDGRELSGKRHVFTHTTVRAGSGIGHHIYSDDRAKCTIFIAIRKNMATTKRFFREAGDETFTLSGYDHSVMCSGDEPLELVARIICD